MKHIKMLSMVLSMSLVFSQVCTVNAEDIIPVPEETIIESNDNEIQDVGIVNSENEDNSEISEGSTDTISDENTNNTDNTNSTDNMDIIDTTDITDTTDIGSENPIDLEIADTDGEYKDIPESEIINAEPITNEEISVIDAITYPLDTDITNEIEVMVSELENFSIVDMFQLSVSDEVEFPASIRFYVENIDYNDTISLLQKNQELWEYVSIDEIDGNYITATFNSLSPIVVLKSEPVQDMVSEPEETELEETEKEESNIKEEEEIGLEEELEKDEQTELITAVGEHTFRATGDIPDDATLIVSEINPCEYEMIEKEMNQADSKKYFRITEAYDIQIILNDGSEYQPVEHNTTVCIDVDNIQIEDNTDVCRLTDEGEVTVFDSIETDTGVSFETDHFSTYTLNTVVYDTENADKVVQAGDNIIAYGFNPINGDFCKVWIFEGTGAIYDGSIGGDYTERTWYSSWYGRTMYADALNVQYVYISDGITEIGDYAFLDYANATFRIPDGITKVGTQGFAYCSDINKIPSALTYAGENSFEYTNVNDASLPAGLTYIGIKAFEGTNISISEVPDAVTYIGDWAFAGCNNITSFTWPSKKSLDTIPKNCFLSCIGLTSVTIPYYVTNIGIGSFSHCPNLTDIYITQYLKGMMKDSSTYTGSFYVNVNNGNLIKTTVHTNNAYVTSYDWTNYNREVTFVTWDNSEPAEPTVVNTWNIGSPTLTDVTATLYQNPLTAKYTLLISGTGDVINYSGYNAVPWSSYDSSIESIIVNDGVTGIGDYYFGNGYNNAVWHITNDIERVGDYSFAYLTNAPTSLPANLKEIGNSAYYQTYKNGRTITSFPSSVTTIGSGAFYECSSLDFPAFPETITKIGQNAFYYCSELSITHLPDTITSIGYNAFYGCSKLAITSIPAGMTLIDMNTFGCCSSITEITIPEGVTTIYDMAFFNCPNLTTITLPNSLTSMNSRRTWYVPSNTPTDIYCSPSNSVAMNYDWSYDNRNVSFLIPPSYTITVPATIELTPSATPDVYSADMDITVKYAFSHSTDYFGVDVRCAGGLTGNQTNNNVALSIGEYKRKIYESDGIYDTDNSYYVANVTPTLSSTITEKDSYSGVVTVYYGINYSQ